MTRREKTEQAILKALDEQLADGGMKSVGVNAVAKRAGVSKELIYRYFEGMPGLMLAWMMSRDFWSSKADIIGSDATSTLPPVTLIQTMLREQEALLSRDQSLAAVRRWELIECNEVSEKLSERREAMARTFVDRLDDLADDTDMPAVVSVLLAGILYLSLRAKTEEVFLGVPLREPEGWGRIWQAVDLLLTALPEDLRNKSLEALENSRASSADSKELRP